MGPVQGFGSNNLSNKDDDKGKVEKTLPLSGFTTESSMPQQCTEDKVSELEHLHSFKDSEVDSHKDEKQMHKTYFKGFIDEQDEFENEVEEESDIVATVEASAVVSSDATKEESKQKAEVKDNAKQETKEQHEKIIEEPKCDETTCKKSVDKQKSIMESVTSGLDYLNEHPLESCCSLISMLSKVISQVVQWFSFNKIAKKGDRIKSGDFEFVKQNDALILVRYVGVNPVVEIPAIVGKLPVKYLHPDFLYSSTNPFDNYKTRSAMAMIKASSQGAFELDEDSNVLSDVREIKLPNTLVSITGGTFVGCKLLRELVIPESVKTFNYSAIKDSGITDVYFNGEIPKGFNVQKFKGNIYVREEYQNENIM